MRIPVAILLAVAVGANGYIYTVTDYYGQCFSSTTVSATSTYPGVTSTLSIPLTTTTTQTKYVYPTVGVQRREGTTEVHEWHCTGTTTYTAKDWTATPNPTLTATSTVWASTSTSTYTYTLCGEGHACG